MLPADELTFVEEDDAADDFPAVSEEEVSGTGEDAGASESSDSYGELHEEDDDIIFFVGDGEDE